MHLFLDALSFPAYAALFSADRKIAAEARFDIDGRENDELLGRLESLLEKGKTAWKDLDGIVAVVGPGGFTGTRLVTLMANAVGWALGTKLFPLDAWGLCELSGAAYPRCARANRTEYLVKSCAAEAPVLAKAAALPAGTYAGPANPLDFAPGTHIISGMDYAEAIRNLDLSTSVKRLVPSYAKAPNIS